MALLISTLSFSLVTFAWISTQKSIDGVSVVSGNLHVNDVSTSVYRYEYPYFDAEETIHNYEGDGKVSASALTASNKNFGMNLFDPTYLTIKNMTTQEGISSLLSTLIVKVSFTITYSTAVKYSFSVKRKTLAGNTDPLASAYLRFLAVPSTTIDGMSYDEANNVANSDLTTDGVARALLFSKVKYYAEASSQSALNHSFPNLTDTSLVFSSGTLIATRPSSDTTSSVLSFYLVMDYDNDLVSGNNGNADYINFYEGSLLGNSYNLVSDFSFILQVEESV